MLNLWALSINIKINAKETDEIGETKVYDGSEICWKTLKHIGEEDDKNYNDATNEKKLKNKTKTALTAGQTH